MCQKQLFGWVLAIFVGWLGKPSTISAELPESVPVFVPFWECNHVRMALTGNARTQTQGPVFLKNQTEGAQGCSFSQNDLFPPVGVFGQHAGVQPLGPLVSGSIQLQLVLGNPFSNPRSGFLTSILPFGVRRQAAWVDTAETPNRICTCNASSQEREVLGAVSTCAMLICQGCYWWSWRFRRQEVL